MKNKKLLTTVALTIIIAFIVPPLAHAKRKSYWARGMGIGAGVGGGIGIGLGIAIASDDCRGTSDSGDCEAMRDVTAVAIPVFFALTGTVIGGLVGLAIPKEPKEPKVSISPSILSSPDGGITGGGLGITGNF